MPTGPSPSDASPRYRLGPGLRLVERSANTLQIGTDPPRRVILNNAPSQAAGLLTALDGREPLDQLLHRQLADPELWTEIVRRLLHAGLIGRISDSDEHVLGLGEERAHLTHRYGTDAAEVLLMRRADAIVEIRGAGRVASTMALQLAASGIGHLHHAPDRPLRRSDLLPPDSGDLDDRTRTAARLKAVSERIQVQPVAGHQRPNVVVIAGDGPADAGLAKTLVQDEIPHMAVWAGAARAVVGPLVLPRMSSCLWCAELSRTDADAGWPLVRQAILREPVAPPAVLAAGAAALAAAEVLELVEGVHRPATVNGTVEWDAASLPRRRSWARHPRCSCQSSRG
ncbi:MAG: hypothetical protein M3Z00_03065 [Actinomycetota bacterium]|nr:hypothetical protein [Actinomycetota bacterium]